MESKYSIERRILQGECDRNLRLSIPSAIQLCMDAASAQTELCDFGIGSLARRGRYWVVTKHRFSFPGGAGLMDDVIATTWPEKTGRVRCDRDFRLEHRDGTPICLGKSEWAVLDKETGRPTPPGEIYPPDMVLTDETNFDTPFARISDDFEGEPYCSRVVTSVDIDRANHMNNVRYFWMLMGTFSCDETEAMDIRELELHYRSQAREGETIFFQRREGNGALEIRGYAADGRTVMLARIVRASDLA